jgi:3-deoxy-D-manno-octulosonate 8-phosphate phosphatase (KDO 8-P phosphatase)
VSSEKGGFLTALTNKLNSLASVKSGAWEEIALFEGVSGQARIDAIDVWLAEKKCTKEECLYMGHDVGDYVCMKYFGISATPISAEKIVKDIAGLVTEREAGRGAVRDLANAILESKGIKPLTLSQK